MDEKKLVDILSDDHAPDVDENARKRAVNMSVAAFKTAQNEKNTQTSQGTSVFSRLMGIGNKKIGTPRMEQQIEKNKRSKFLYGATATAMALVLIGGLSLTQLSDTVDRYEEQGVASNPIEQSKDTSIPKERVANLGELFASEKDEETTSDDEEVAPVYVEAVDVQNEATINEAVGADIRGVPVVKDMTPVPIETPTTGRDVPTVEQFADRLRVGKAQGLDSKSKNTEVDPLHQWRVLQEERLSTGTANVLGKNVAENKPSFLHPIEPIHPLPEYHQNRDKFEKFTPSSFKQVATDPVSTFSSDVDTASYAFIRKSINNGELPSPSQVRAEEMINYFDYAYPFSGNLSEPFKPSVTIVDSPWAKGRKLMHVGVKGYDVGTEALRSNIVLLLDVSGSMRAPDKLPLVKSSMKMLLDSLRADDTISIVTYAGRTSVVLKPTKVSERSRILTAMNILRSGGGTAGAAGIDLAYDMAERGFDKRAVNRVILATDGDFNLGTKDLGELKRKIEAKREKGIFLSVLGFGTGNYNDHLMQILAQNGNGTAAYIDSLKEAQKVLVEEATSSLFTIAKDVKFQVEFNPNAVAEYRLIGYETRALKREDFNNDKIDAGDIGAGHTVTAIYEFVPVGSDAVTMDPLRYDNQTVTKAAKPAVGQNEEYAFVKVRYKLPQGNTSKLITRAVTQNDYVPMLSSAPCGPEQACTQATHDLHFATAVAAYAQKLQGGHYVGDFSYDNIIMLAQSGKGPDPYGYRSEFINMVRLTKSLSR